MIHLHAYETPAGGQKAAKAALVGLVWLLEVSVTGDAARLMLAMVAVVAMFVLMLRWLRVNRGRIELAETRVTRREAASRFVARPLAPPQAVHSTHDAGSTAQSR